MSMQAPKNDPVALAGQSYVKAQFESLGWGAVLNPEHDLGTDLWLSARDEDLRDLLSMMGAQVKTGPSYFERPEIDGEGNVIGWWYAESCKKHFDYWTQHAVPHILILRDPDKDFSYWTHVTADVVQSTGKGAKVLVRSDQTIGGTDRQALVAVAMSPIGSANLDGSAWGTRWKIPTDDRLRFALLAPRLVAPHRNRGETDVDAISAIAMLAQGRFRELDPFASSDLRSESDRVLDADSWCWELFDAMLTWVHRADLSDLRDLRESDSPTHRIARAVVLATALAEQGRFTEGLARIRDTEDLSGASAADTAWLRCHEARCLAELGRMDEARAVAISVQELRASSRSDPTAAALVATSVILVFDTGEVISSNVGELIEAADTSTRWWRAQTVTRGLSKQFSDAFRTWVRDESITFAAEDVVYASLRSSTLLAGFSADHADWRGAMTMLAQRTLMVESGSEHILDALTDMVHAGAGKELELTLKKLASDGSTTALTSLVSAIDLALTSRSSIHSALKVLHRAGDFAREEEADRHLAYLLDALNDLSAFVERVKPRFLVLDALLRSVEGLIRSASTVARRKVMDFLLDLPVIEDQLTAQAYGRIISSIDSRWWTPADLDRLAGRSGDNWELQDDIDLLRRRRDPDFRADLENRIRAGEFTALDVFGDVTELPSDLARLAIEHYSDAVAAQIGRAKQGMIGFGGPDLGRTLVILNAWHAPEADWDRVRELLSDPNSHSSQILGAIQVIGRTAEHLPEQERARLRPALESIAAGSTTHTEVPLVGSTPNPASASKLALMQLFPELFTDEALRALLSGTGDDRQVAAWLLGTRRAPGDVALIFALQSDMDGATRTAALVALTHVLLASADLVDDVRADIIARIESCSPAAASDIAKFVANQPANGRAMPLLEILASHPSAKIRARGATLIDRLA